MRSQRPTSVQAGHPAEKALEILQFEANAGRLDPELVQILVDSQVYRRILEEDWHQL
jgi:hypothetical protein